MIKLIIKRTKKNRILEKGVVDKARRRILNNGCSDPCLTTNVIQEDFGMGVNPSSRENKSIGMSSSKKTLCYTEAHNIIEKAANAFTTFKLLSSISKASTLSPKQFPFLSTCLNLLFHTQFENDKNNEEHDQRIDNILCSWAMRREKIAKDGDCCFRSVARNICTKRNSRELNEEADNHLTALGIYSNSEDEMVRALRLLTVQEWIQNRSDYEHFVTTDDFDKEVERFKNQGYFTGELGNVMTLAMSNVLRMPIIIFSSLENYPVIPVLPRHQLKNITPLYICFNGAGCGHYDFVSLTLMGSSAQETATSHLKETERKEVSCSCGVNKNGTHWQNICNNEAGAYSSRCKCLKARIGCGRNCRCKGCCNPYGSRQKQVTVDCSPRKRQKFDFQKSTRSTSTKSKDFLVQKGEKPRESSLTDEEYFVLEEIIMHQKSNGKEVIVHETLDFYKFIQSVCQQAESPLLSLREKEMKDIKKALAAHEHQVSVMRAVFSKQVEMSFTKLK